MFWTRIVWLVSELADRNQNNEETEGLHPDWMDELLGMNYDSSLEPGRKRIGDGQ